MLQKMQQQMHEQDLWTPPWAKKADFNLSALLHKQTHDTLTSSHWRICTRYANRCICTNTAHRYECMCRALRLKGSLHLSLISKTRLIVKIFGNTKSCFHTLYSPCDAVWLFPWQRLLLYSQYTWQMFCLILLFLFAVFVICCYPNFFNIFSNACVCVCVCLCRFA